MTEIFRYMSEGGIVAICIAAVSLAAWYIAGGAWLRARALVRMLNDTMFSGYKDKLLVDAQLQELDRTLRILATMAATLPLLGLLGTVLGMLITFNVIEGYGTGHPSMLAGGIRRALLTTQAGLWTALPVLLMHEMISGKTRKAAYESNIQFGNDNANHGGREKLSQPD